MAAEAASTSKSSAPLTHYDPASCSWRTSQQSLVEDSTAFSETWPRAGTMLGGRCWPLPTWERPIAASDGGACAGVPTPPAQGFVTFVDRDKTKPKKHPGYCYLLAGFKPVGFTKAGLVALQLLPDDMPAPMEPQT